jgi:formyltetrahydrofolate deformylase
MFPMHNSTILLVSCPDRKGVVASIADFIFRHNGNILFNDEHGDEESNLFLTRVEFDAADFNFDLQRFPEEFAPIAREFQMNWRLAHSADRSRIAIFVSKYDHCLQDLLYRHQSGELRCEIPLIVSNHPDNQRIADFYRVPYFIVPATKITSMKRSKSKSRSSVNTSAASSFLRAICRCSRTSSSRHWAPRT